MLFKSLCKQTETFYNGTLMMAVRPPNIALKDANDYSEKLMVNNGSKSF